MPLLNVIDYQYISKAFKDNNPTSLDDTFKDEKDLEKEKLFDHLSKPKHSRNNS